MNDVYQKKIRIAKFLSSKGYGSRREIEQLIFDNNIKVNKKIINTPITFVDQKDEISINNKKINTYSKKEIWKFYKPINYIVSRKQTDERPTIYEILPKNLKKIKTIGRLDINSEGLLLLTHDGSTIRNLELPKNKFVRKYKIRAYGHLNFENIERISKGGKFINNYYKPFKYKILKNISRNIWLEFEVTEGKNNEVRNLCSLINLQVNKLIRIEYGPFKLKNMLPGQIIRAEKEELDIYENNIRKI